MNELNEAIKVLPASRGYKSAKVLILYWQDGAKGYKHEGRTVGRIFEHLFRYRVHEEPIPSVNSYFHLLRTVSK